MNVLKNIKKMSKILTAEELLENYKFKAGQHIGNSDYDLMITYAKEFAKLHVKEARKQFKIVFSEIDDVYPFMRDDKLSDVYPLRKIK